MNGSQMPKLLLRAEGLAVAVAAPVCYFHAGYPWWLLLALLLAPDLLMAGYLRGPRLGAGAYNAAHTYIGPVVLLAIGVVAAVDVALEVALIWALHIGFDRALGYGLKYPDDFKHTHMQQL